MIAAFGQRVVDWQRRHGRNDLPWQRSADPYPIWVSEIMLQQTQVVTVLPYFRRFMERFPRIDILARASEDDVLRSWSGLGYYSRARNLHRAAAIVVDRHGGRFPIDFDEVQSLPGIGRSTAGAIVALAYGAPRHTRWQRQAGAREAPRHRRLSRDPAVAARLWRCAEELVPGREAGRYTQGMMDLGSTVCTRTRPRCVDCPVAEDCIAFRQGRVAELPAARPRRAVPHRSTVMLVLETGGEVMLERRPAPGIWGGLWSFPEVEIEEGADSACRERFGFEPQSRVPLAPVEHAFTHYRLTIHPLRLSGERNGRRAGEPGQVWLTVADAIGAAVPKPVRHILRSL